MAQPSVVDVYLSSLDQSHADHGGPIGRVTELINGIATHFTPESQSVAARFDIETRDGFQSLSQVLRKASDGTVASGSWSNPELLAEFDAQLVSICSGIPRVSNGTDWTYYDAARVISNTLTQDVFHTTDRVIQAPSSATIGAVKCSVWTEVSYSPAGNPIGTTYVGFKDGKTWLRTATVLHGPGVANQPVLAKVVTDGTVFWTFTNEDTTGHILIKVWDTHGVQLASTSVVKNSTTSPGDWDVAYLTGSHVSLIQPTDGTGAADGVDFSSLTYATGTITENRNSDATVHCRGALSWLTNDLDGFGYLATLGAGRQIWGYQASSASSLHEFDVGNFVADSRYLDSFIGWPIASGTAGQPILFVGVSYLADGTTASAGPKFDPAFRETTVYSCTWTGTVAVARKNMSTVPVSRAFLHNGEYSYFSYYQSGSGSVNNVAPTTVTHAAGDFMTGPVSQPITVQAGDTVDGPIVTLPGNGVQPLNFTGSLAIAAGDKVENYTCVAGDPMNHLGLPVGTALLKWSLANITSGNTTGALEITTSSDASANGIWQCAEQIASGAIVYTFPFNASGQTVNAPITFAATGHCQFLQLSRYYIPDLPATLSAAYVQALTLTWAGDTVAGNNGSFSVFYAEFDTNADPATGHWLSPFLKPNVKVLNVSSAFSASTAPTATLTPTNPNTWSFGSTDNYFDSSDTGAFLTLTDSVPPSGTPAADLLSFGITGSAFTHSVQTAGTDATGVLAWLWKKAPFPTAEISQDISQAYRIRLGNVTFDYSLIGALINVAGAVVAKNDGVYKVLSIDPSDTGNHTVFVQPTSVNGGQRNQNFSGVETITMFPANNVAPEFQPTWFITPATGTQPQVGAFERGIADADWRQEGQLVSGQPFPNLYPRALSDVSPDLSVVLPYRVRSFVSGQLLTAPTGQVVNAASTLLQSTIGLKVFSLSPNNGDPLVAFDELLLPGPMAASFTESGFHEQGITVGVEQPFVVSEENDTSVGVIGMVPLQKYTYQVVATATDENGDSVVSVPSPALEVTLTGTNNTVTIGLRTINPVDTNGVPITNAFGLSNRANVTYQISRTAFVNGTPTTNLYNITDPLNPNGPLYPGSGAGSGFTFLNDGHTVYFRDQTADAVIVDNEVIYTGQGLLPAFPAPPFSQGCVWQNRTWLCGYDGALWMSNEKQEGSSLSYFPAFRYIFPSKVVACAYLDSFLYVFCDDTTVWYIPATTYPDATGNPNSGTLPTPRRLPFRNSCTGHATTIREGVVYSSTVGAGEQLWLIDRSQQNHWLSQPVQDSFQSPITGLAVDSQQRLFVANGQLWCYDGIPRLWSQAVVPSAPSRLSTLQGQVTYQDTNYVVPQVQGTHVDVLGSTTYPVPLDVTLASLNFAQVRAFLCCWAMQVMGEYRGPHNLNAIISYPDDMPDFPTTFGPFPADPTKPYLIEINPINERCSTFGLRVWSSFEGVDSPGDSFSLELVSAKVGLVPGQRDVPASRRAAGR